MTGLVLEGGGHRGIYSAGVMDVLMENGITFDGVIGVSAGAVFGVSFVSGQIGRSITYTEKYCSSSDYMGLGSLVKTGDLFNVDFCYRQIPEVLVPFNNQAFVDSKIPFYAVCTDVESGNAVYHRCKDLYGEEMKWLQASASMPCVAKTVFTDGKKLLDGGVADSIPLEYFQSAGYEKNLVILTQPAGYKKSANKMFPLIKLMYGKYPAFVQAMKNRHVVYNEELKYLESCVENKTAFVIRPSENPVAGRLEQNPEKMRNTYNLGRKDCESVLPELRKFLSEK